MFVCSTGEPVLAQVVGFSEQGDAYRRISYERAATVVFCFAMQFLCLKMCVHGGSAVPQGGMGDRHLATAPRDVAGDRLPSGGAGHGGVPQWDICIQKTTCSENWLKKKV